MNLTRLDFPYIIGIRQDVPVPITPWSPSTLTGLVGWYSAKQQVYSDAGSTPITNGQGAQQVNDLSGLGHHLKQATSGTRPIWNDSSFNGMAGLTFDGSDWLRTDVDSFVLSSTTTLSAYCVCRPNSSFVINNRWLAYFGNGQTADFNNTPSAALFIHRGASAEVATYRNGNLSLASAAGDTNYRMGTIFDGANNTLYLNNSGATPVASTATFSSPGTICVGAGDTVSAPINGTPIIIGEIVITKTALNSTERSNLNDYFVSGWGL